MGARREDMRGVDVRVAPRRFGRGRRAAFAAAAFACRALGGRALYRRRLRPGRFVVRREEVRVRGLAPELDGLVVAHLSDLHAGPFVGAGDLAPALRVVAAAAPDLVAWTGDYVTHVPEDAVAVARDLAALSPRLGTYAVFGNHDYRGRRETRIAEAFAPHGVRFLRNASVRVEADGASVLVAGIEDAEEGRVVDPDAALAGARPGELVLALSHAPRAAPGLVARGAHVVLAGHTHGVQADLPLLRRLGPPHPGVRVELGAGVLLVSRGIGVVGAPVRVGAPAEAVLVTLRAAPGAPA